MWMDQTVPKVRDMTLSLQKAKTTAKVMVEPTSLTNWRQVKWQFLQCLSSHYLPVPHSHSAQQPNFQSVRNNNSSTCLSQRSFVKLDLLNLAKYHEILTWKMFQKCRALWSNKWPPLSNQCVIRACEETFSALVLQRFFFFQSVSCVPQSYTR